MPYGTLSVKHVSARSYRNFVDCASQRKSLYKPFLAQTAAEAFVALKNLGGNELGRKKLVNVAHGGRYRNLPASEEDKGSRRGVFFYMIVCNLLSKGLYDAPMEPKKEGRSVFLCAKNKERSVVVFL
jgi:hypothetical protein